MIHPIRLFGDPVLRRRATAVTSFDDELKALVTDMFETMYAAEGVGLAAPQIGVPLRVFVALQLPDPTDDDLEEETPFEQRVEHVLVNPKVTRRAGVQLARDGCLSLPGLTAQDVPRDLEVEVEFQDLGGAAHTIVASGYFAHVLQHEYDHLEGVLYYDHLPAPRRAAFLEQNRKELADMQRRAKSLLRDDKAKGATQPRPDGRVPRQDRVDGRARIKPGGRLSAKR